MAFKDIFNSLPATPRFDNLTVEFDFSWCLLHRNDNLHMDGSKEIWNSNKSNLNKVRNPLAPTMFSPSTFSSLAIIGGHRNNCSKVSAKIVDCIHYFTHLMFCHTFFILNNRTRIVSEAPRVDSLFNGEKGSNGMYYQVRVKEVEQTKRTQLFCCQEVQLASIPFFRHLLYLGSIRRRVLPNK